MHTTNIYTHARIYNFETDYELKIIYDFERY